MDIKLTEKDMQDLLDGFTIYKYNDVQEIRIQIEKIDESKLLSYENADGGG